MAVSQNGWRANDRSVISTRIVMGSSVKLAVRNGAPGDLLLTLAAAFDRYVDDIDAVRDDWGYAERPIRGQTITLSNHASGTAIDLDATEHVLGKRGTFTQQQVAKIREILRACLNLVRWGGDYSGRADEMHFELVDGSTEEQCQRALDNLRKWFGGDPVPVIAAGADEILHNGSRSSEVERWQKHCNVFYSRFTPKLKEDGIFGNGTEKRTREIQQFLGIGVDGKVGPETKRATKFN